MNKKAIAILGAIFLLIVATLGFLIFQKRASKSAPTPASQSQNPSNQNQSGSSATSDTTGSPGGGASGGNEPSVPKKGAVKLASEAVVSPVLFFQGTGITYFNTQGQLFQADLQLSGAQLLLTNKRELTVPLKSGITKILWPQAGNSYLAEIGGNGAKKSWSFYNSQTGGYVDLPGQITAIDWLPGGDKILYIWLGGDGKSSLYTADPDTKNFSRVSPIFENDDAISVSPDGKSFLFYRSGSSDLKNKITLGSTDGKFFKDMATEGYNFGVLWSPDSRKFLFGKRDPVSQRYGLWLKDTTSGEAKNLGLLTTPDKAVWRQDGRVFFAAVPNLPATGSSGGLTQDIVVKVDAETLQQTPYDTVAAVDARDMFLNFVGDKLFFKNQQDGALYYLDLTASSAANSSGN